MFYFRVSRHVGKEKNEAKSEHRILYPTISKTYPQSKMTIGTFKSYLRVVSLVQAFPCFAFVIPSSSQRTGTAIRGLPSAFIALDDDTLDQATSLSMEFAHHNMIASNDVVDQIGDSLQSLAMGLLVFLVIFNVVTSLIKKYLDDVVLPQKVKSEILEMEQEDPETWARLQARLNEGETIEDRPDLVDELVERLKW